MIDRTLASKPDQQESFYFQLIPLSLAIIDPQSQLPAPDTTYRFTIYKGISTFIKVSRSLMKTNSLLMQISLP